MQRIATATKATDLFGAGKHGFKDGNLALAISPTDLAAVWFNQVQEELIGLIESAALAPGAGVTQVKDAINIMIRSMAGAVAPNTGTADALIGVYAPVVAALANGLTVYVRAAAANATTTPTFTPNSVLPIAAKTIVKGSNQALVAGDIAGAGHWLELQYDATLDKWILLNPATGINAFASGQAWTNVSGSRVNNTTYTNSTAKPIMVLANYTGPLSTACSVLGYVNGVQVSYHYVGGASGLSHAMTCCMVVPPGSTYLVNGSGSITGWQELR